MRFLGFGSKPERPGAAKVSCSSKAFDCEIVGEAKFQAELHGLVTAMRKSGEELLIVSVEHDAGNRYDANALAVKCEGKIIGYLPREAAATLAAGVSRFRRNQGRWPTCYGRPSSGGNYGTIGVWLDLDLRTLGLDEGELDDISWYARPHSAGSARSSGTGFRTGFGEAESTDLEDDSYDLSWAVTLADDNAAAVGQLRSLLGISRSPIERHYMYAALEDRLYKLRDTSSMALDAYDSACREHDSEMDSIVPELKRKFGMIPLLETYRQCAIRHQKAKDFVEGAWWAERGLALYGDSAGKPEWPADLRSRLDKFRKKLT